MALDPLTTKLTGHRNNIKIALIIGVVAMVINVINGFSFDTFLWLFSIIQAYRWYTLSETYIHDRNPMIMNKLKSYKTYYIVLWIAAGASSVLLWGDLYADTILGIIVSGAASYQMNQFETDAASGPGMQGQAMPNQAMNPRFQQNQGFNQPTAPIQQQQTQNEESVFCGQCGTRQNGSPKFCSSCGAQIIG